MIAVGSWWQSRSDPWYKVRVENIDTGLNPNPTLTKIWHRYYDINEHPHDMDWYTEVEFLRNYEPAQWPTLWDRLMTEPTAQE